MPVVLLLKISSQFTFVSSYLFTVLGSYELLAYFASAFLFVNIYIFKGYLSLAEKKKSVLNSSTASFKFTKYLKRD